MQSPATLELPNRFCSALSVGRRFLAREHDDVHSENSEFFAVHLTAVAAQYQSHHQPISVGTNCGVPCCGTCGRNRTTSRLIPPAVEIHRTSSGRGGPTALPGSRRNGGTSGGSDAPPGAVRSSPARAARLARQCRAVSSSRGGVMPCCDRSSGGWKTGRPGGVTGIGAPGSPRCYRHYREKMGRDSSSACTYIGCQVKRSTATLPSGFLGPVRRLGGRHPVHRGVHPPAGESNTRWRCALRPIPSENLTKI